MLSVWVSLCSMLVVAASEIESGMRSITVTTQLSDCVGLCKLVQTIAVSPKSRAVTVPFTTLATDSCIDVHDTVVLHASIGLTA